MAAALKVQHLPDAYVLPKCGGIEFTGYGGTSAGALVATLAAVGYSGEEIYNLLRTTFHPRTCLDDGGTLLGNVTELFASAIELYKSRRNWFFKVPDCLRLRSRALTVHCRFIAECGMYDGKRLRENVTFG